MRQQLVEVVAGIHREVENRDTCASQTLGKEMKSTCAPALRTNDKSQSDDSADDHSHGLVDQANVEGVLEEEDRAEHDRHRTDPRQPCAAKDHFQFTL